MRDVVLRFHGELGDFLPPARRGRDFAVAPGARRSVKDLIESLGVPHCEASVVFVDGDAAPLDRIVEGGGRIDVHPAPASPTDARFVLDGHLGRLAAYLRAAGFDVAHDRDADDASIARTADAEDRVVLTRDVGLLKRGLVRRGRFVRATDPRAQLVEIVRAFRLAGREKPFTRCLACNTPLVPATKDEAKDAVPPRIAERFDEFSRCPTCRRVFWRGTHHERLARLIEEAFAPSA